MDREPGPNQEPAQTSSEEAEFIGPRIEDRLQPEIMRQLVMVEALRHLARDLLFFVPSEELIRMQAEAMDIKTPDERRIEILYKWEEQARQQLNLNPENVGQDIGMQLMSASNWLGIGNEDITRERLNGVYWYADQEQFFFVTERIDTIVDAYRSDAFEIPEDQ